MDGTRARAAAVLTVLGVFLLIVASAVQIPRYAGPLPGWNPDATSPEEGPPVLECPDDPAESEAAPAWCNAPEGPNLGEELGESARIDLSSLESAFTVTAVLAVLGLIGAAGYFLLRWWGERSVDRSEPPEVVEDLELAAQVTGAVRERALAEDKPRNAIVACWVALEDAAEGAGVHRSGSETAEEFTQRVLERWDVDAATITELAELYRTARFSRQEQTTEDRNRAVAALDRVHKAIETRRDAQKNTETGL